MSAAIRFCLSVFLSFLLVFQTSPIDTTMAEEIPTNPCIKILSYQVGSTTYWVNRQPKGPMEVAPEITNSRMFLVIRYVTTEIESTLMMWDSLERKVTITLPTGTKLELWIGKPQARVTNPDGSYNDVWIDDDNHNVSPYIKNPGYTMLPMRFVSKYLGAENILWDDKERIVDLQFIDYQCLRQTSRILGYVRAVSSFDDKTDQVLFVPDDGEVTSLYTNPSLKASNSDVELANYIGCVEVDVIGNWIVSWRVLPEQDSCGDIVGIEFRQLDLLLNELTVKDSNWGEVRLTFRGFSEIKYFNLRIDDRWVIKNRAILDHKGPGEEQTTIFNFDLKCLNGQKVSSLNYAASLTTTIKKTMPQVMMVSEVDDGRVCMIQGLSFEEEKYETSSVVPDGDSPTQTPAPPQDGQGGGQALKTASHKNFPNQQCHKMECMPAAVSNSLKFLKEKHKLQLTDAQTSIEEMKKATDWRSSSFGSPVKTWWSTKKKYMEDKKYKITTRRITDFDLIINEIAKGQDVELVVWMEAYMGGKRRVIHGHGVAVTGVTKTDEGYDVDYVNDLDQQDDTEGTEGTCSTTYNTEFGLFMNGVWVANCDHYYFVVECPDVVPPDGCSTPVPVAPTGGTPTTTTPTPVTQPSSTKPAEEGKKPEETAKTVNKIKIVKQEKDQKAEDAVKFNAPVFELDNIPINSLDLSTLSVELEPDTNYVWQVESKTLGGHSCGVTHESEFRTISDRLKWQTVEIIGSKTSGEIETRQIACADDGVFTGQIRADSQLYRDLFGVSIADYTGFAKVCINEDGRIYDWIPIEWMTSHKDVLDARIIKVQGVDNENTIPYLYGFDDSGMLCTYTYDPETFPDIAKDFSYLAYGKRLWWESEFELVDISLWDESKQVISKGCDLISSDGSKVIMRNDEGEISEFSLFACQFDENLVDITTYSGCVWVEIAGDAVISWRATPDVDLCGLGFDVFFSQLDYSIGGVEERDTSFGRIDVSCTPYDSLLYFNLMFANNWVVQNAPVYPGAKRSFTQFFDLQSGDGINITSTSYSASFTKYKKTTAGESTSSATVGQSYYTVTPDSVSEKKGFSYISPGSKVYKANNIDEWTVSEIPSLDELGDIGSTPSLVSGLFKYLNIKHELGINERLIDTDAIKAATDWDDDLGCKSRDGKEFTDVSWCKQLTKYTRRANIPLQIEKLENQSELMRKVSNGNLVVAYGLNGDSGVLALLSAVAVTDENSYVIDIIYDTDQSDYECGVSKVKTILDPSGNKLLYDPWFSSCDSLDFYTISVTGEDVQPVTLVTPGKSERLDDPYPTFKWLPYDSEQPVLYCFNLYEVKTGQTVSSAIKSEPILSVVGTEKTIIKYPTDAQPLKKNVVYCWYVEAYTKEREFLADSGTSIFTYAPSECMFIEGIVQKVARDPNTSNFIIEFKMCDEKILKVLSPSDLYEENGSIRISKYKGCASLCIHTSSKGYILDSWVRLDDCCRDDEPCVEVEGTINSATEIVGSKYPIVVNFISCSDGMSITYYAKDNLTDTTGLRMLAGFIGCATLCVTEAGIIKSWTFNQRDDCCRVICCEWDAVWATPNKQPPSIIGCPGENFSLEKLIYIKNNCTGDDVEVIVTSTIEGVGVVDTGNATIAPGSVVIYSLDIKLPESLPKTLEIVVNACNTTKQFRVTLHEEPGCKECCDYSFDWSQETKLELGRYNTLVVCPDDNVTLSAVVTNNCRDKTISGVLLLEKQRGGTFDFVSEIRVAVNPESTSRIEVPFDTSEVDDTTISYRLKFIPDCEGSETSLVFTVEKGKNCPEDDITLVLLVKSSDCDKNLIYAVEAGIDKEWYLVPNELCDTYLPNTCYEVTGTLVKPNTIIAKSTVEVDCP